VQSQKYTEQFSFDAVSTLNGARNITNKTITEINIPLPNVKHIIKIAQ